MKKLALALAALAITAASASAADYTKAPPPVVAPVYSWTGFYVGGNLGYGWGKAQSDVAVPASTAPAFGCYLNCGHPIPIPGVAFADTAKPAGTIGGGQIGYNWQTSTNLVLGLEADLQGADQKARASATDPFDFVNFQGFCFPLPDTPCETRVIGTTSTAHDANLSWFGTVRGRVGYAADNVLFYGTGGLAYGRVGVSGATIVSGAETCAYYLLNTGCALRGPVPFGSTTAFAASSVNVGWTAGAGIEWAFSGPWSMKVEYLYLDLGRLNQTAITAAGSVETVSTRFTDNIVRAGLNYRFGG